MIQILNKNREQIPPTGIYIGRGSPLGNPFSHIASNHPQIKRLVSSREESIRCFSGHIKEQVDEGNPEFCDALNELIIRNLKKENLNLVCFCKPLPCHGDVIAEFVQSQKYCINWFSNMRRLRKPFLYQGIEFKTVENFYQAMKLPKNDLEGRKRIAAMSAFGSKKESKKIPKNEEKRELSLQVMEFGLRKKFVEDDFWREKLINYRGEIVEWNNWGDKFFGKCIFSGEGENNLGKILTKIRNELV